MPTTWQDSSGRTWDSSIKLSDVARLKKEIGFDFFHAKDYQPFFEDVLRRLDVIAELHRPQFDKAGLSKEDFCDLLTEAFDRLDQVQSAFVESIRIFSKSIGKSAIGDLVERGLQASRMADDKATAKLRSDETTIAIERAIDSEIAKLDAAFDAAFDKLAT